jgi:hypothetical protein
VSNRLQGSNIRATARFESPIHAEIFAVPENSRIRRIPTVVATGLAVVQPAKYPPILLYNIQKTDVAPAVSRTNIKGTLSRISRHTNAT